MNDIGEARTLARDLLAEALPRRWSHVQGVAAQAERVAADLGLDRRVLVSAAWLHDIGYAPQLASTGFHPLDGARFLRLAVWPDNVCELVAHHTCAAVEAHRRGLGDMLCTEFQDRPGPERDALWAADATTGPDGERLTLDERVAEVLDRYGADHLVGQCMQQIHPDLAAAVQCTRARTGRTVSR